MKKKWRKRIKERYLPVNKKKIGKYEETKYKLNTTVIRRMIVQMIQKKICRLDW